MIKGTTKSGFKYEIEKERLNNYELIETIVELDTNPLIITKTVDLLLGKEQTKRLKDHLRTESGLVPLDKISDEVTEIFQNQSATKNL